MAIWKPSFLRLPEELIAAIIYELPMSGILRCRLVSRRLNTLIQNSSPIQFKIELRAHALVHCPESTMSSFSALKLLREQQNRWRKCQWETAIEIPLTGGCKTYDIRNGVWAYGQNDTLTLPDYTKRISSFMLRSPESSKITTEIADTAESAYGDATASAVANDESRSSEAGDEAARRLKAYSSWSMLDYHVVIRDFSIDPLVDLLVMVVETADNENPFQLQFLKLSTGQVHPDAGSPVLKIEMTTSQPATCTFTIQLHSEYVGVLVRHDGILGDYDYFALWDWHSGERLMSLTGPEGTFFDDFAFIDDSCLMLTVHPRAPALLDIWRFSKGRVPQLIGRFGMPPTTRQHLYVEVHFDGGPIASAGGPKSLDGLPFALAPTSDVLSISFGIIEEPPPEVETTHLVRYTMIMRPSLMLKKFAEHEYEWPSAGCCQCLALPWKKWGAECTRWISLGNESMNWEPCTVGGRFAVVTPYNPSGSDNTTPLLDLPQVIRIYDFRPEIVRRYAVDGKINDKTESVVIEPSVLDKKSIFEEDVSTALPYYVSTSQVLPFKVSGIMLDENHVVCTKAEFDDEWRKLLVLCF